MEGWCRRRHSIPFILNRLFDRYQGPILSILVLGDASPDWRPSQHESAFAGCHAVVRYPVIKLWDWREGLSDLPALKRLTRLAATVATADELLQAAVKEARS